MRSVYQYDVVVVGAGHAGVEAACAAARLGARVALLTANLDTVGQMSCNPAIGGVGKAQLVREVDALGGVMGGAIDATGIQFRVLNRSKGPAMHGPRAQADKRLYQMEVKRIVEETPGLDLRQETAEDLLLEPSTSHGPGAPVWRITGVRVRGDATYHAAAVVLTTGTFLQAVMHTGEAQTAGGRAGEGTTSGVSRALVRAGIGIDRFKTGTPCRLSATSLDFSLLDEQPGDAEPQPFSFLTDSIQQAQMVCWITRTTPAIHELIRANLHRAPMYTGQIESRGPRYCPSIEDKVVRFADKESHQLFLEPEGRQTREIYVNGISTSLPRDVQDAMIHLVPGLERARIMRYGYAVEYDYCPPDQLTPALESKRVRGLFCAGQISWRAPTRPSRSRPGSRSCSSATTPTSASSSTISSPAASMSPTGCSPVAPSIASPSVTTTPTAGSRPRRRSWASPSRSGSPAWRPSWPRSRPRWPCWPGTASRACRSPTG